MTTRPRPRELRPAESYTSLNGVTIALIAEPHAAPSLSVEARRPLDAAHAAHHDAASSRRFGLVARPKLHTSESALSVVSTASTSSDLVVSASGPMPSPFFVPPPAKPLRHLAHSHAEPSHDHAAQRAPSPFPRPDSPLPALPSSSALAHPPAPVPPSTSHYPSPPTAHNSLAAFKAAQAAADSQGGCSSSTHRTSSDVDLDLSFERASALRDSRGSSSLLHDELVVEAHEGEHERDGAEGDWVGIEAQERASPRPAVHDIPERDLVRSSSGQLVGARHARATSAMDLRAQFKAAADAEGAQGRDDVAITIDALGSTAGEWRYGGDGEGEEGEGEYDAVRRHVIRQGKRPLEGARAQHEPDEYALTAPLEPVERFATLSPHEHEQDGGGGFAFNPTGTLWREPPRSAPPLSQPTFADRQQQHQQGHASRPSQSRGFPLPLRLLQHTKRSAEALVSPASAFARSTGGGRVRAATTGTVADSDVDSLAGASPMFDSDGDHDGTVRTAPSTPNDTPLFQDCFDSDDMTPPLPHAVPHRLGSSALAGLGLDFGDRDRDDALEARDEFPLVPLRHNVRRVSLPPVAERRRSVRHDKIPSLSISPPPPMVEERLSEDGARSVGTSSSTLSSTDSGVDPTVSPSRRLSRRLSLAAAGPTAPAADPGPRPPPPASRPSVHFDTRSTSFPFLHKTDTPSSTTSSSTAGPSIPTPQHLLVSPSPGPNGIKRDPSFSFSPAPLRLVKVQLLRAAGYGTGASSSAETPAAAEDARPASPGAPVEATVDVAAAVGDGETATRVRRASPVAWWDDLGGWFQAPSGWVDEVVPAKLAFLAGFLFFAPWLWLLGGWYLRPLDGEFHSQRGTRCRDDQCGCGRIMRGSGSGGVGVAAHGSERAQLGDEGERYAGLDRWVFMNRVAATGGGAGVAVLFGVAVWAAATA
ncbi:hypothetical protein JCM8208_002233 [Rhodotorula glutinis]